MTRQSNVLHRTAEIDEVVRTTNLLWIEAAALVARRHGEDVSDIVGTSGPLTDQQREHLGLGTSLAELIRAEVAATTAPHAVDSIK